MVQKMEKFESKNQDGEIHRHTYLSIYVSYHFYLF